MNPGNQTTEILVPYAFEVFDPPETSTPFTASVYEPNGPPVAVLVTQPGGGSSWVRYRIDGGDPEATIGHVIPDGAAGIVIYGAKAIKAFRMIEPDGSLSVQVTYFRGGN